MRLRALHSPWRILALVVVLVAIVAAWRAGLFHLHDTTRLRQLIDGVRQTRGLPLVFVAGYAVLSAIGVPASALTLAGGALFGVGRGILLNWIGEFGGAMLAFGLVRTMFPESGARLLSGDHGVARMLARGGGAPMLLFRLRLLPVAPFALLNAGAALSVMSWRSYAVATALGIIPITVIYTLFSASLIAGVEGSGSRALLTALVSGALVIGLTFARRRT